MKGQEIGLNRQGISEANWLLMSVDRSTQLQFLFSVSLSFKCLCACEMMSCDVFPFQTDN